MSWNTWNIATSVLVNQPIESASNVDAIVIGVGKDRIPAQGQKSSFSRFTNQFQSILDFKGTVGDLYLAYNIQGISSPRVLLVGLGDADRSASPALAEEVREAAAKAAKFLRDKGCTKIAVEALYGDAQSTAEGIILGLYKFDELKTESKRNPEKKVPAITEIQFYAANDEEQKNWNSGVIISNAQNTARRLAELPANICTPQYFVNFISDIFRDVPNVKVIGHPASWAEEKKMNSFLSVTHGSDTPAMFLEIHYNGAGNNNSQPLVFVGKGVTFDSGGISLKPSEGMGDMRGDCGGACAVTMAALALSKMQLPINLIILAPLTENLPSGKATKPSDVVVASNGKSIEINNTDAEGRLILADALVYSATFNPHTVIDVATLTGGVGIALGGAFSGCFTRSDQLWTEMQQAGAKANERMWRMPLDPHYRKMIDSELADITNSSGRQGSPCTAATFLSEFIELERWMHIDIAGTTLPGKRYVSYLPPGMCGIPTRALIQFARDFVSK